jgi:hypothetical protein
MTVGTQRSCFLDYGLHPIREPGKRGAGQAPPCPAASEESVARHAAGRGQAVFSASRRVAIACVIAARVAWVSLRGLSIMKSCVMPS